MTSAGSAKQTASDSSDFYLSVHEGISKKYEHVDMQVK